MTAFGRFSVLVASVMVVMAGPLSVKGSLWVEFEPSDAAPGAEVIAVTIGQDATTGALANLSPDNVVVFYLGAEEDDVDGPGDSAAMRIAKLELDEAGHGQLAFTAPDIELGPMSLTCTARPAHSTQEDSHSPKQAFSMSHKPNYLRQA